MRNGSCDVRDEARSPQRRSFARWCGFWLLAACSGANLAGRSATADELSRFVQIEDQSTSDRPIARMAQQPDWEAVPPFRPQQGDADERVAPGGETQGGPRGEFFGPGQVRLPTLTSPKQRAGITPRPSKETLARFEQYVDRTVDPENTLDLIQGRPRLLVLKQPPVRVQIADENIATYTVISENQVSVVGNDIGSTILNFWFLGQDGQEVVISYLVRVVPDPEARERLETVYAALAEEINHMFPDSVVQLTLVGDKLVLSGSAKDTIEAAQILRVVAANAPGGAGGEGTAASDIPLGAVNLNVVAAPDEFGELPEQGLDRFLLREPLPNVINLLRVPGEQQVMLRVTVAEVNRSAARSIGIDFSIMNNAGEAVFSSLTGGLLPTTVSGSGVSSVVTGGNLPVSIDNGQVVLAIEALRNINMARSLAEPNLTTLNGQPAQFRAGGEFPVPAASVAFGGVGQGVQFIPFGVQLRFVPYITDRDRVRLQVSANVSTRDPSLGANIGGSAIAGGTSVSGLNSRTFSSTVELREGQTLAVAGLIQNNFGSTAVRVPLLGDLPLVGNFFAKNQTSAGEQELVILITPELVAPLDACDTPLLPGADVFEPSDLEFYLGSRLESRRSQDFRSAARTDIHRLLSYQDCEDLFIVGRQGHTINCCGQPQPSGCRPRPPEVLEAESIPAGEVIQE